MVGILSVFIREVKRIASSKICIWGIIGVPLLSLIVLMSMMHEGLPHKIPMAVVDQDNTSTTRALIRELDAFPKTDIRFKSLSFREARERMERCEVYAVLTIPKNFTQEALNGQQPKLVYYTENAFFVSGNLLQADLRTICTLASASVGLKTALAHGFSTTQIVPVLQPIVLDTHILGNPLTNYSICLNSNILPSILQLIVLIFTVSAFGCEQKSGSSSELMRLGNNNIMSVIIGKLFPYTILYMLIALVFMSVMFFYNSFPLKTGFFPMFLNYLCMILGAQGLGLIFVAVYQSYRMGLSLASLMGMLSFSLTGFSFPVEAMHPSLQAVSYIFPMRHFFLIYVNQALDGFPIGFVAYHFAILLGFTLIGLLFAPKIRLFLTSEYEE